MAIGKVKWFGGLRKEDNRVNDFGFISLVPEARDIYVNRCEIPENVQALIEGKEGEGVYLEFDVIEDQRGAQAVNVKLVEAVGMIDWHERGRPYLKTENFYLEVLLIHASGVLVKQGDILQYSFRYNEKYRRHETIKFSKVDRFTEKLEVIEKCAGSEISRIQNFFLVFLLTKYLDSLSYPDALAFVISKIEKIQNLAENERQIVVKN